ncbi:DUF397 domain-containing protein [Streptomyces sp. NPDC093109]|uniref:DUF397 domain-containing protein n=1 Tax=Streptomyces sp. NPDC093109 TaxID=3154977 RepID=UPI00344B2820
MSKQANPSVAPTSWVKSSYSSGDRDCVEVATAGHATGLRDSKVPNGPHLAVTAAAFAAFVAGLKADGPDRTA